MAAKIGSLHVNLDLDTARFQAGLAQTQGQMAKFQGTMKRVAGAIGGLFVADAIVGIGRSAFEMASGMSEAAGRIGVSVEALQELQTAARGSGVSNEQLESSMARLNVQLGDLQGGSATAAKAFAAIGLSADDLKGKNPQESLGLIADKLMAIQDPAARAAAAQDIFGRSYANLLPMLKDGAAGLEEAARQSREHGQLSQEAADALDGLADSWGDFKEYALIGVANAMPPALDALKRVADEFDRTRKESWEAGQAIREAFNGAVGSVRISTGGIQGALATMAANAGIEIGRMASNVANRMAGFAAQMAEVGRQIGAGLVRGIRNSAGAVVDAARNLAASLPDWVKRVLDINSPSRVFMQIGEYISEGLAIGIDSKGDRARDAMRGLLARLFPEMDRLAKYQAELGLIEGSALSDDDKARTRLALARERDGIGREPVEIKALTQGPIADLERETMRLAERTQVATVRVGQSFKDMAEKAMSSLQSLVGAIKGGGFLDILQGLLNFGMQLGSMGVFGTKIAGRLNKVEARAMGGPISAGRPYLVGERGPELVVPRHGGRVIPNNELGGGRVQRVEIVDTTGLFRFRVNEQIGMAAPSIASGGAALAGQQAAFHRSRRLA